MDQLSQLIRQRPLKYLPEVSLLLLWHFRRGYDLRRTMAGSPYLWSDDVDGTFGKWVRTRYQVRARALSHFDAIISFSENEIDAFAKYFELLEEFCQEAPTIARAIETNELRIKRLTFVEVIKNIRANPTQYLGVPSFLACCSFLMGERHASEDLALPSEEERDVFDSFTRWVETTKNRAKPRHWFKIVTFWSGGVDCGHVEKGAFNLLFKWLDEYTVEIGKAGLFSVTSAKLDC